MPANGRWDLICHLKVKTKHLSSATDGTDAEINYVVS